MAKMMAKSGSGSKTSTRTFKTSIDIKAKTRDGLVTLLNQQLADCFDLYSQTKQAHWNVKGTDFIALHELFDDLAAVVLPFADELAERATQLTQEQRSRTTHRSPRNGRQESRVGRGE